MLQLQPTGLQINNEKIGSVQESFKRKNERKLFLRLEVSILTKIQKNVYI